MSYPSRSDLVTAVKNPKHFFSNTTLRDGAAIQKGSRILQYSGGYTSVFPFILKGRVKIALRCWIADIGDTKRRSEAISKYLDKLESKYFVTFKFHENALNIDGVKHPVVVMDWVEGDPLKEFLNDNCDEFDVVIPQILANFKELTNYLHENKISHGDLQHGNILVKSDKSLVLIDYDSMFIDELEGLKDIIKGLPGYQHPLRQKNIFLSPKADYFSELVIYTSLYAFKLYPTLWRKYYLTEDLLFSHQDFIDPHSSVLIGELKRHQDPDFQKLLSSLLDQLTCKSFDDLKPLDQLLVDPKKRIIDKFDQQPNPQVIETPDSGKIIDRF